ncbi:MAG: proline iminopeptidase-family hydrolase [Woeseiaceae bacterium]|nr:proline iminopeptidase-family hydrolase [Woeseiaceae bacterium]
MSSISRKFRKTHLRVAWLCLGLLASPTVYAQAPLTGEGFVAVPGGPVWYQVTGEGAGVPLLVLHGGPGGTSCGYQQFSVLGDERPVIRYDQLGSGRSGRPNDKSLWTVERYVEELHELRESLGLDRLHLLGHSWGAALAAAYLLEKGTDGVVSVTFSSPLLSTPAWVADANFLRKQLPADVQETLDRHEAAGTTDSAEYQSASAAFYERFVYAGERPERPADCEAAPWNPIIYRHMWGPTEFHATGTLVDFDLSPRLAEIDVPALFVTGEFDEARPQTVARFSRSVPGARFEVIEGVAHASFSKAPERYLAMLEAFLDHAEALAQN